MLKNKWIQLPIFLVSILIGFQSNAALTITSVTGVSNVEADVTTGLISQIYGGIGGTPCIGDGVNTCDSCDGTGLVACNPESVYSTLSAQFTLSTTSTYTGTVSVIFLKSDNSSIYTVTGATFAQGKVTVGIPWDKLCGAFSQSGGSACSGDFSDASVKIGIDKGNNGSLDTDEESLTIKATLHVVSTTLNTQPTECPLGTESSEGACYFETYPGDSKVFIDVFNFGESYSASGLKYIGAVFFEAQASAVDGSDDLATLNSITNASTYTALSLKTSGSDLILSDEKIADLSNDTRYCFVYATQDYAKNIFYFTPAASFTNSSKFCGTPSEVIGLLDGKKCFIATAAYGSSMDPHVETLRQFRDRILLRTSIGQNFVQFYYQHSPQWAAEIRHNETARTVARIALWPFVYIAEWMLEMFT